jgi:glycosidase
MFALRPNQALMLALAREDPEPIRQVLEDLPDLPSQGQWTTFLRNHGRYGDEIGMGDDLSLPEREFVRTPMQWTDTPQRGILPCPAKPACRPGD